MALVIAHTFAQIKQLIMKKILSFLMVGAMVSASAQLDVNQLATPFTITFDATVAGVSNGQFLGSGKQPGPQAGELDADAWEWLGASDGDYNFGTISITGDAARGASTGGESSGGFYAFDTGGGDHMLGIQPSTADLTPGFITLRIENTTGVDVGVIDLSYEIWEFNNADRSSYLNFAWSDDNVSFSPVPSLDHNTPEIADGTPAWVMTNKSVTISGFNLPSGQSMYLRWESDDFVGGGSRDEFGIDDISITAYEPLPEVNIDDVQWIEWEDNGTIDVDMTITGSNGSPTIVKVWALTESTASGADYTMPISLTFAGTTDETVSFTIDITDDSDVEADEYIALIIGDSVNVAVGSDNMTGVYILDDDNDTPVGTETITLEKIGTYAVASGSAEISAYDSTTMKLFVANSTNNEVDIVNMADPTNPTNIATIDISTYGDLNSITVYNDTFAICCANSTDITLDGTVAFFDGAGNFVNSVTAGANPDMITFTPDHMKLIVANEGEPNDAYTTDPEGTISFIDLSNGYAAATVINASFNEFDAQQAALEADDVRIFGPGASVSEDLEPEYVTFSSDGATAWVSLQENNAIAVLDVANDTIVDVWGLGYKDHSVVGNEFDASNNSYDILFSNWPTLGMYQPDAITSYEVGGVEYIVTANEGDARDYGGFSEEDRVKDLDLDDTQFGDFEHFLLVDENLGRTKTTYENGDIGSDGDYEEIYTYGARSFSIWNASTGALVYDSGSEFERITADDPKIGGIFNTTDDDNDYKDRSDDKGPEPEGVAIGFVNDTAYAFIGLERVGGIMVYNVNDPANAEFVYYINTRDTASVGGDLAPEGLFFLSEEESPIDTALVVVSFEVSGTVGIFKVNKWYEPDVTSIEEETIADFVVYPNPTKDVVFFTTLMDVEIIDLAGKVVLTATQTDRIDVADLTNGVYLIRNAEGETARFTKQ
jgi:hypothetical protein